MWRNFLINVLITIILSLWLVFGGYSLSCIAAYLLGCTPCLITLITSIIFLTAIIILIIISVYKHKTILKPVLWAFLSSIFISSFTDTIVLLHKLGDNEYRGKVLFSRGTSSSSTASTGYFYNILGYKIINASGKASYHEDMLYLLTSSKIYAIDYDGNYLYNEDWITNKDFSNYVYKKSIKDIIQPFTYEHYIFFENNKEGKKLFGSFDDIIYLGSDGKTLFFQTNELDGTHDVYEIIETTYHDLYLNRIIDLDNSFNYELNIIPDARNNIFLFYTTVNGWTMYFYNKNGKKINTYISTKKMRIEGYGADDKIYISYTSGPDEKIIAWIDKDYNCEHLFTCTGEYQVYFEGSYIKYIQYQYYEESIILNVETGKEIRSLDKFNKREGNKFYDTYREECVYL